MERRGTKRSLPSQEVCKPSTDRKEDLAFDLAKSEGEGVCVCVSGGAGAKWRYEGTIVDRGGARLGVSRFFVMLVFLFCKLFENYSQTNFPVIKTKPFKVTLLFKKYGGYLGLSG